MSLKLGLIRNYIQTAQRITSAGNRWRLKEIDFAICYSRQRLTLTSPQTL